MTAVTIQRSPANSPKQLTSAVGAPRPPGASGLPGPAALPRSQLIGQSRYAASGSGSSLATLAR
jgi:hypothetical protein